MNNVSTAVIKTPCKSLSALFSLPSPLRAHTSSLLLKSRCSSFPPSYTGLQARVKQSVQWQLAMPERPFSTCSARLARNRASKWAASVAAPAPRRRSRRTSGDVEEDYAAFGLPLPSGDLNQAEIHSIFGSGVSVELGNAIVRHMNYRRRSGSLIQEQCDFLPETGITQSMAFEALKYLREQDPNFNEREAGAAWAEAEADKVAEEYVQRAEDLGLYKRDENAPARGQQGSDYGRSRYGSSALDQIREANKAHWEESQRLKKEAEGKAERERVRQLKAAKDQNSEQASTEGASEGGQESTSSSQSRDIAVQQPVQKAWLQPVERKPWVKYYEEQATILKENTVPQMSLLRRLGPSALVTLLIIGSCMFLSDNYVPPPKSARMFPDTPPSVATLGALTAAYLAVFIGWRMPPLWRFFNTYFTASPGYPYALSMIGSTFAHQEMRHLFNTLIWLWPFGLMRESLLTPRMATRSVTNLVYSA